MDGDGSGGLRDDGMGRSLRVDGANSRWIGAGPGLVAGVPGEDPRRSTTRATLVILAVLMIGFSATPLVNVVRGRRQNKDYDLWQETGKVVLDGKDIYPKRPGPFPFMYPPSCAAMLAPLSPLPRGGFVLALLLLNSAAWAAVIAGSVYLSTGRVRGVPPGLYLLPSLAVIPFVHDTYLLGQPALVLLALLLGAFVAIRNRRPGTAGALVAAAAAIKAYPILVVGDFVYRRRWRAALATVATLAALTFVAPLAFRSPGQVADDFVSWTKGMLLKYDEESIGQRPDRAYSFKNQSIQATVHRLSRPVLADGEADRAWRVNLLSLDFRSVTVLMLASVGGLGAFYLWSTWGARLRPAPSDAAEQAMVTLLVLMLAPLSFNYSYVWLIFPLTLLMHLAGSAPVGSPLRRWAVASIVVSVGLLALALPWRRSAQAYGNVFFGGLTLLIGLGVILRNGWIGAAVTPLDGPAVPRLETGRPVSTG